MKKQTAVEWLIKKLENRQNGIFDGLPHLSVDEIYTKAKAMEKGQIEYSFERGYVSGYIDDDKNGAIFYTETFQSNASFPNEN